MNNIWFALGFMAAGYGICWLHNKATWRKYDEGKKEVANGKYTRGETDAAGGIACAGRAPFKRNAAH